MEIKKCNKPTFSVIGKKGSTEDGSGFAAELWKKANASMGEVISKAKRDGKGRVVGCWGLRSDFGMKYQEWEEEQGLYLAGIEVTDNAGAPYGWEKWTIPASNYVSVKVEGKVEDAIREVKTYAREKGLLISGAYQEYMNPLMPGQLFLFFPVKDKESFVFPALSER